MGNILIIVLFHEECMKIFSVAGFCALSLCSLSHSYQLQGKVLDESGNPVIGADVLLISKNKATVTNANGEFLIREDEASLKRRNSGLQSFSLQNGIFAVFVNTSQPFQLKVFDLVGNEVFSEVRRGFGEHRLDFQKLSSQGRYMVSFQTGNHREVISVSTGESFFGKTFGDNETYERRSLKKELFLLDSLRISAELYETLTVALPSLDTNLVLTLHKKELQYAFGWAKGNAPVPTRGCGKDWNRVKSGSYEFTWSKGRRTIRIDIPDNYDNSKPYRLVFGMHCMGGWAGGVQQDGYYGLKPLDSEKTTIFVAPEGNGNQAPWNQDDYTLFDELLADLEENLCIDSSRVFSAGFSYGSMFTNGLSRNHKDKLRAVAVYETAEINIYTPEVDTEGSIAWMGVVALQDNLCTPELGRAARNTALRYNGPNFTDASGEQAEEYLGNGPHICYDYKSVDPRFPVKWCTQNGGHIWDHKDPGEQQSWVPKTTWDFFTQF